METIINRMVMVQSVRMAGCGHIVYMDSDQMTELRRTHKSYYCTICKYTNYFPDESDVEALERRLNHANDLKETYKSQRDSTRRSLTAHKGHTTRIKKRVAAGVCPCCNRTFRNLARHMSTKHSDYAGT